MTALYELAAEFKSVADRLEETDLDEQTIADTLEGYAAEFDDKVVSIVSLIRNLETTAEAIKEAERHQKERRDAIEKKAQWLRDYVLRNMTTVGCEKVSCGLFAVRVRQNSPSVQIADDADIPASYINQKIVVSPDKKALKEALESGVEIKGVSLVRSNSLTIK